VHSVVPQAKRVVSKVLQLPVFTQSVGHAAN
jgi:hypothetical protein